MDGFLFEQKVNQIIGEEFKRISARVKAGYDQVMSYQERMNRWEEKIEIVRAQVARIGKFDGAIESFKS